MARCFIIFYSVFIVLQIGNNTYAVPFDKEEQKLKFDSLYSLVKENLDNNPDTALYYAKQQKRIAFENDDFYEKILSCYTVGHVYRKSHYFDQAAYHYFEGLELLKKPEKQKHKKLKVSYLKNIGVIYINTYNYNLALEYTNRALELAQIVESKEKISELIYNMGFINTKLENYELAKEYFSKAIDLELKIDYKFQLAKAYNMLGNVYHHQMLFDSARLYYLKALEISNIEKSLKKQKAIYLSNLGENYFKQNKYPEAKEKYLSALAISKKLDYIDQTKFILNNIGDILLEESDYNAAIGYYNECITLSKNTDVIDEEYKRAVKNIALAYEETGEYQLASKYKGEFIDQVEKIEETKENLSQQNAQYRMKEVEWEMEKKAKEAKIAKIETENIWVKILVTIALIVIFVGSRYTYIYHKKIARIKEVVFMDDVDPDEYA